MRNFLENLCTTDAKVRRQRLERALRAQFGNRLKVERRVWGASHPVTETVNFLVVFGRSQDHFLLGAHYDQVASSPGGNDNGAAVTQLFSAAKRLQARVEAGEAEPDCTFCWWDHEEWHPSYVMGSRVYVEDHANALPRKAVVFDVSGIGELYVSEADVTGLLPELPTRGTPTSDHEILAEAGIPATLVCALPPEEMGVWMPSTWSTLHTPRDTAALVSDATLELGACLALELISRFKAA